MQDLFTQEERTFSVSSDSIAEETTSQEPVYWSCRICHTPSKMVPDDMPPSDVKGFIDHPIKGMICLKCHREGRSAE